MAETEQSFRSRVNSLIFHSGRAILSAWIKPTVLGIEQLNVDESDLICYVLPFQSSADLMVADKACETNGLARPFLAIPSLPEDRSVFHLGHPEGRLGRKTLRQHSETMIRLFQHQKQTHQKIKVIPISLFWGHQPDQEKSIFKLLLSENWTATSRFKKLLAIIFHPNHILVEFNEPICLSTIIDGEENEEKQIRKLSRLLRVRFNNQKQAIIGPDLSHRRTLINTIVTSSAIRQAIDKECERKNLSMDKVEKQAIKYAREIASHQSYRVIRFFHVLLSWLWNNLYDGIQVSHIDRVKQLAQSHEIIYTPCHRSHIDYLLLSYVLYHNGLTPPHIAAGINLNLPIVGPLLRRAGAFFMRRSFRGNALYKSVFDEYLHQMFIKGYSVEYFIEGGRSRTGRTLYPRTGMLNMTLNSFQKDSTRPICMMPVYFGYERVLESSTYLKELSGNHKKSESLFDLFGIFRLFRHDFGQVTVNFGEPLILADFIAEHQPDWQQPDNKVDLSELSGELATELATRINSATAVNAVGLVATALLSSPRQTMEEKHLLQQIRLLKQLAEQLNHHNNYTVLNFSADEILDTAISITGLSRTEHSFGTTISASNELSVLLTYYSNSNAHIFALPSLIVRYIKTQQTTSEEQLLKFCTTLYPYLQSEYFLNNAPATTNLKTIIKVLVSLELISFDQQLLQFHPPVAAHQFAAVQNLAEIIAPTLERFHIVTALLHSGDGRTIRQLETDAAAIAQQLSAIYGINSPDFFERSLFSNFIRTMKNRDVISTQDSAVVLQPQFSDLSETVSLTLDSDVQYNVIQAIDPY